MIVAPRVFLSSNPPTSAASTGSPNPAPDLSLSRGCICTVYWWARASRSPTSPLPAAYRFCSPTLTLSRNAGGTGWFRIFAPPAPGPTTTSIR